MATLTRWSDPIAPTWLGNDRDPQPFTIRYKRMSRGEIKEMQVRLRELYGSDPTAAKLAEAYAAVVKGPLRAAGAQDGEPALVVDGEKILDGDLAALFAVGLEEGPLVHGPLIHEITRTLFVVVNGLPEVLEGESSGSRGGASSTRAGRTEDGEPARIADA
jgi:hypothetical protein